MSLIRLLGGIALLLLALMLGFPVHGADKSSDQGRHVSVDGRSIGQWIQDLESHDAGIRRNAAFALGRLGTDAGAAVPALTKALGDTDTRVRETACLALAVIGRAALPALCDSLKASDATVRLLAADAMCQMGAGAQPAVPALIDSLHDKDRSVCLKALGAFGVIGPAASQAMPAVFGCLKSDDPKIRCAAVQALGRIGTNRDEVVRSLIGLLSDNSIEVRAAAAERLGWMATPEATAGLVQVLGDPNSVVRLAALRALRIISAADMVTNTGDAETNRGKVIGPSTQSKSIPGTVIRALMGALKDSDAGCRGEAVMALAEFGPAAKAAVPMLKSAGAHDNSMAVRARAQAALQRIEARGRRKARRPQLIVASKRKVSSIAFSPDGRWLASGDDDWHFRVWDLTSGKSVLESKTGGEPLDIVERQAFSPDSTQVAFIADRSNLQIYELATGKKVLSVEVPGFSCAFSANGKNIAVTRFREASIRDASSGRLLFSLESSPTLFQAIAFSPDGKEVVLASHSGVMTYDAATGRRRNQRDAKGLFMALSGDGRRAAWLMFRRDLGPQISVTDVATGQEVCCLKGRFSLHAAFSADGKTLAFTNWDQVYLWREGAGTDRLLGKTVNTIESIALSADGTQLAIGNSEGWIAICDVADLLPPRVI
jgi:HEAT repeat protein